MDMGFIVDERTKVRLQVSTLPIRLLQIFAWVLTSGGTISNDVWIRCKCRKRVLITEARGHQKGGLRQASIFFDTKGHLLDGKRSRLCEISLLE
jgi:hypothetical protein